MRIGFIAFAVVFVMALTFMVISMFLSKGTRTLAKKGMDITKKLMNDGNEVLEVLEERLDGKTKTKHRHTKKCPYCDSNIDENAVKCENCGAQQN